MANQTMIDIATSIGGVQPALIDALTGANGSAAFRKLPMKPVIGMIEQFIQRNVRPTVAFRNFAGKITPSKTGKTPVSEGVFLLSGAAELDAQKVESAADGEAEREQEIQSFLEAMGFKLSYSMFYGSNKLDGGFDGLLKRIPVGGDTYETAAASNETVSIYALKLGPTAFQGIYNPGPVGEIIEAKDYGRISDKDSNGLVSEVYRTTFNAKFGLAQYHPKAAGRLGRCDGTHKPTVTLMNSLFNKMGWKPDILITNMLGAGWLSELKQAVMTMSPSDKDFDITMSDYQGIPIIVDSAISSDENGITV